MRPGIPANGRENGAGELPAGRGRYVHAGLTAASLLPTTARGSAGTVVFGPGYRGSAAGELTPLPRRGAIPCVFIPCKIPQPLKRRGPNTRHDAYRTARHIRTCRDLRGAHVRAVHGAAGAGAVHGRASRGLPVPDGNGARDLWSDPGGAADPVRNPFRPGGSQAADRAGPGTVDRRKRGGRAGGDGVRADCWPGAAGSGGGGGGGTGPHGRSDHRGAAHPRAGGDRTFDRPELQRGDGPGTGCGSVVRAFGHLLGDGGPGRVGHAAAVSLGAAATTVTAAPGHGPDPRRSVACAARPRS